MSIRQGIRTILSLDSVVIIENRRRTNYENSKNTPRHQVIDRKFDWPTIRSEIIRDILTALLLNNVLRGYKRDDLVPKNAHHKSTRVAMI